MQVPLSRFEDFVEESIVKRGNTLYSTGKVQDFVPSSDGGAQATVQGTELYDVSIELDNGMLHAHRCSCPYVYGPICKHMVAVMLSIRDGAVEPKIAKPKKERKPRKTKEESELEQVQLVLDKRSPNELREFLKEQCRLDPTFRRRLLTMFIDATSEESKAFYTKRIKELYSAAKLGRGYLDTRGEKILSDSIAPLRNLAAQRMDDGQYLSAAFIAQALFEEMIRVISQAFDRSGVVVDNIHFAHEILVSLATRELPPDVWKVMWDFVYTAAKKRKFSGWDWHYDCLALAGHLAHDATSIALARKLFDEELEFAQPYMHDYINTLLIAFLRAKQPEELDRLLDVEKRSSAFQMAAVHRAFEQKNWQEAKRLAEAGLAEAEGSNVTDWYQQLLRVAEETFDQQGVQDHARTLVLLDYQNRDKWLSIFRGAIPAEQWEAEVRRLISEFDNERQHLRGKVIAELLFEIGDAHGLMEYINANTAARGEHGLLAIEYEHFLKDEFTDALIELYGRYAKSIFEDQSSRATYQYGCSFIRRMIKLGGDDRAQRLIEATRAAYPQRRALMEELMRI